MWSAIEQAINQRCAKHFNVQNSETVTGGDINKAYKISDEQHSYFVKVNSCDHIKQFECEAYNLAQIALVDEVATPQVIAIDTNSEYSFLILEYLPLSYHLNPNWFSLGQKLAQLHKNSSHGQFGWQMDNYIGSTLQPNPWSHHWRTFFAEQRIGWQLQLLAEKSINIGKVSHIIDCCHRALAKHQVTPCLVHGDLWQGNIGFSKYGGYIFDPACYYGDHEVDIAMTELFGSLPMAFYQGYQNIIPLAKGYEHRKLVYNLYHILNHANLFGGHYIDQAKAMVSRIIATTPH